MGEEDLARVFRTLGEKVQDEDLTEMLKSGDGDPHTKSLFVTHQQLIKLLPPLCPSKVSYKPKLSHAREDGAGRVGVSELIGVSLLCCCCCCW